MTDESPRDWFQKAVLIWVDMERGLYEWGKKPPKNKDGSYRVVKSQILKDCGISRDYHDQKGRIWENPHFDGKKGKR